MVALGPTFSKALKMCPEFYQMIHLLFIHSSEKYLLQDSVPDTQFELKITLQDRHYGFHFTNGVEGVKHGKQGSEV